MEKSIIQKKEQCNSKSDGIFPIIYTIFYCISTLLNGYSSGVGSLSIASIGYLVLSIFGLLYIIIAKKSLRNVWFIPIIMLVFLLICTSLSILFGDFQIFSLESIFMDFIKIGIWVISTSFLAVYLLDYCLAKKTLNIIAIFCTIYLIIQSIFFYIFGITLTNLFSFGFLKPNYDYYFSYDIYSGQFSYRPASFFSEPSFYGYFVLMVFAINLFDRKFIKEKLLFLCVLFLGLLLSTSSSAIYLTILTIFIYVVYKNKGWKKFLSIAIVLLSAALLFYFISNFKFSDNQIGRTFSYSVNKINDISIISRVGGSFEHLDKLNSFQKLFGIGVGNENLFISEGVSNENIYMNSVTTMIFWSGFFGFTLFTLLLVYMFFKTKNPVARFILVLYYFNGFYSAFYFSVFGIMYLSLFICIVYAEKRSDLIE